MDRGQDQYGWTMWPVHILLRLCSSAGIMDGEYTTADIMKMQESFVKVIIIVKFISMFGKQEAVLLVVVVHTVPVLWI